MNDSKGTIEILPGASINEKDKKGPSYCSNKPKVCSNRSSSFPYLKYQNPELSKVHLRKVLS